VILQRPDCVLADDTKHCLEHLDSSVYSCLHQQGRGQMVSSRPIARKPDGRCSYVRASAIGMNFNAAEFIQ
jgi:hypothetical protein